MIRIGGAVKVRLVAADACGVGAGQVVIAIHVTLCALQRRMRAGQREARSRVIEGSVAPGRGVMALLASRWEVRLHVIRIGRSVEIRLVAADACGVCAGQIVIVVYVALCASHGRVSTSQRETGRRVIECCSRPRCGGVALLTRLRESRCHVVRIRRSLEVLQVTTDASRIGAGQVVVAIHVALRALQRRVSAGQRETGRRVIERRVIPRSSVVALLAGLRES